MLIDYKTNTAEEKELLLHFQKCDSQFIPPLSKRVNLIDYSKKLVEYSETFEAWNRKNLVGVISIYLNDDKTKIGYISNVSVLEAFWNKGIAKKLIKSLKNYSFKLDFLKLSLEVNKDNIKAITFYKAQGFKIDKEESNIFIMCYKKKTKE